MRRWCPFFRAIIDIKYKNGLRVSVQFYRAIAGVDKLVLLPPKVQIELGSIFSTVTKGVISTDTVISHDKIALK